MTGHDLRLAAQSPKVSTPQVHVNTGTHVNTTAVNASKISHIKAMPGSNSLKRDNF